MILYELVQGLAPFLQDISSQPNKRTNSPKKNVCDFTIVAAAIEEKLENRIISTGVSLTRSRGSVGGSTA